MDYKKLVEDLRREAVNQQIVIWKVGPWSELEKAANAIETLLAERDAYLRRSCMNCKHKGNRGACRSCFRSSGKEDYWEWRGQETE